MYEAKTECFYSIRRKDIALKIGMTYETVCRIINKKQLTTKTTAFCISKAINNDAEIEDFFIKVNRKGN